jgi:membrane-bound serine protease (ClpP class)
MTMIYAIALAVIGLAAIIIELFVPAAGLIGIVGIACIIAGISMSFISYGTVIGLLFLLAMLILTPLTIILWFKRFPRSMVGKKLILFNPGEKPGDPPPPLIPDSPLLDLMGTALSDLRPSGSVLIDGKKYSVVTGGEYIPKGRGIRVNSVNGNRIVVREEKTEGMLDRET